MLNKCVTDNTTRYFWGLRDAIGHCTAFIASQSSPSQSAGWKGSPKQRMEFLYYTKLIFFTIRYADADGIAELDTDFRSEQVNESCESK